MVPARGLIGYTTEFMSITKGFGIYNHTFDSITTNATWSCWWTTPWCLVSMETGKATTYGIMQVEDRGTIFVEPGTEIYEGMIVGEHNRDNDFTVNICKIKQKQIFVQQQRSNNCY